MPQWSDEICRTQLRTTGDFVILLTHSPVQKVVMSSDYQNVVYGNRMLWSAENMHSRVSMFFENVLFPIVGSYLLLSLCMNTLYNLNNMLSRNEKHCFCF